MDNRTKARLSAAHRQVEWQLARRGGTTYRYNRKHKSQPLFNGYELAIGLLAGLIVGLYFAV